ncbi:L-type lectin-domain containing receptor kinase IV-2 [Nymphaea thermarum]|nr:L-type lectin-domain containing receptor kinase IV-2 [Nymphaea thermarum]
MACFILPSPVPRTLLLFSYLLLLRLPRQATSTTTNFTFNGFLNSNLTLRDASVVTSTGLLRLTNSSRQLGHGNKGHAFYPVPLQFKNHSSGSTTLSFSTRFVFAINSQTEKSGGHGLAFAIVPSTELSTAAGGEYLGLFNESNNGNSSNHIFAVEFDTVRSGSFRDIDNNHVGVNINGMISNTSETAAYFNVKNEKEVMDLLSGKQVQAWIDYDGRHKQLNITIAPSTLSYRPSRPLISYTTDLSSVLRDVMYVGFSAGTAGYASEHYLSAWNFEIDREATAPNVSRVPSAPIIAISESHFKPSKLIPYSSTLAVFLLMATLGVICQTYRRWKLTAETLEDWELEYPHRFSYKELYRATKGFKREILGKGGFGSVYRAVLASNGMEVAIKRVSHNSKQGMKEFVAEVSSLGRLSHRNLVQLQGWCRREAELILVYEYMPNGSLDSFLFEDSKRILSWEERFKILKGVASGLFYLHEGWEQIIVHRDVKASNVLLDADLTPKLGDFGLARLYEHGTNPKTTHVVGTFGYMAPELSRTWKATTSSDVYAYGALLLEVACGRRPVEPDESYEVSVLVEWVHMLWKNGEILSALDKRLGLDYVEEEAELVLKLGVLCSQSVPEVRPSMRQVIQFLDGDASVKEFALDKLVIDDNQGFDQLVLPFPLPEKLFSDCSSQFEAHDHSVIEFSQEFK